jgi:hypothetical protein
MTRDEARRRAVEAAADAAYVSEALVELVMAPYLAAMADAGWQMVRVPPIMPALLAPVDSATKRTTDWQVGWAAGWNACRRAMLADGAGNG